MLVWSYYCRSNISISQSKIRKSFCSTEVLYNVCIVFTDWWRHEQRYELWTSITCLPKRPELGLLKHCCSVPILLLVPGRPVLILLCYVELCSQVYELGWNQDWNWNWIQNWPTSVNTFSHILHNFCYWSMLQVQIILLESFCTSIMLMSNVVIEMTKWKVQSF
jgi:hypothetical protein